MRLRPRGKLPVLFSRSENSVTLMAASTCGKLGTSELCAAVKCYCV